jgi:anti-sigma B factor antagonist
MKITTEKQANFFLISLDGDLDASNALDLDKEIKKAIELNEKNIVINCSGLNYVSSAGLGVFISYLKEFEEKNIEFALANVSPRIFEIINLLGLDKLITIHQNIPK